MSLSSHQDFPRFLKKFTSGFSTSQVLMLLPQVQFSHENGAHLNLMREGDL